jgi:hypothetical protein
MGGGVENGLNVLAKNGLYRLAHKVALIAVFKAFFENDTSFIHGVQHIVNIRFRMRKMRAEDSLEKHTPCNELLVKERS